MVHLISYDLAKGGDYESLISNIKDFPNWAHITESTWAIVTTLSCREVRDRLRPLLPVGSPLFVNRASGEAAWYNVMCNDDWLVAQLSK